MQPGDLWDFLVTSRLDGEFQRHFPKSLTGAPSSKGKSPTTQEADVTVQIEEYIEMYRNWLIVLPEASSTIRRIMEEAGMHVDSEVFKATLKDHDLDAQTVSVALVECAQRSSNPPADTAPSSPKMLTDRPTSGSPKNQRIHSHTTNEQKGSKIKLKFGLKAKFGAIYNDVVSGEIELSEALLDFRKAANDPKMPDAELLRLFQDFGIPADMFLAVRDDKDLNETSKDSLKAKFLDIYHGIGVGRVDFSNVLSMFRKVAGDLATSDVELMRLFEDFEILGDMFLDAKEAGDSTCSTSSPGLAHGLPNVAAASPRPKRQRSINSGLGKENIKKTCRSYAGSGSNGDSGESVMSRIRFFANRILNRDPNRKSVMSPDSLPELGSLYGPDTLSRPDALSKPASLSSKRAQAWNRTWKPPPYLEEDLDLNVEQLFERTKNVLEILRFDRMKRVTKSERDANMVLDHRSFLHQPHTPSGTGSSRASSTTNLNKLFDKYRGRAPLLFLL